MKEFDTSINRRGFIRKILELLFLIAILQIPIVKISELILERQSTKEEALLAIKKSHGSGQFLYGPILSANYKVQNQKQVKGKVSESNVTLNILPDELFIDTDLRVTETYKGIFSIPTFVGKIKLKGHYHAENLKFKHPNNQLPYESLEIKVGMQELQSIRGAVTGSISGLANKLDFAPITIASGIKGLVATINPNLIKSNDLIPFEIELNLSGSEEITFAPLSKNSEVQIVGNWGLPSFIGSYSPANQEIKDRYFKANWQISSFANEAPLKWVGGLENISSNTAKLGVQLIPPIDAHRMATRAIKYELVFIALTILIFLTIEIVYKVKIHSIQYLFISAALILFYLLLLSLAEQLSFFIAFVLATTLVLLLVTSYCRSVLKDGRKPWLIASLLGFFYTFLYTLLQEQDLSLLIGSIGLTFILAGFMYFTRKVDWFEVFGDRSDDNSDASKS